MTPCQVFRFGMCFEDQNLVQVQSNITKTLEAMVFPLLLIILLWVIFLVDKWANLELYKWGVLPKTLVGLRGIVFMPLLHAQNDIHHLINNSIPLFVLLSSLIYFYREIALKLVVMLWVSTGLMVWIFAENTGAYHIGMSGVIYGLVSFLFFSGTIRKYLPLQGISLFVVFLYGNLVWGLLPLKEGISWEGHLMGFIAGTVFAFVFRKESTQRPKYQYEIERDLGIEPPDVEGKIREFQRTRALYEELEGEKPKMVQRVIRFVYHSPKNKK